MNVNSRTLENNTQETEARAVGRLETQPQSPVDGKLTPKLPKAGSTLHIGP